MSAYLCVPKDFALLAVYALKPGAPRHFVNLDKKEYIDVENAADLALILAKENIKSLEALYPKYGPAGGFLCGTVEEFLAEVKLAAARRYDYEGLVEIKNTLYRYDYQACEHPDYRESDAYHLVRALKDQLLNEFADRYDMMRAA